MCTPSWGHVKSERTERNLAFYPIHGSLDAVVEAGRASEWCNFGEAQVRLRTELDDWGKRVGMDSSRLKKAMGICLWGDSAEFVKRDSLDLLVFTVFQAWPAEDSGYVDSTSGSSAGVVARGATPSTAYLL